MQTQWSWILQLCSCVEQHLKENAVYFEVRSCLVQYVQQMHLFSFISNCHVLFAPTSFLVMPKSPWTTLKISKIPFKGNSAVIGQAACTGWRISSRSPW